MMTVWAAAPARSDEPHRRPMVGGNDPSTILTLCVIPALYALLKQWQLERAPRAEHLR